MAELDRVRALIQVRQPRLKDFLQPYDKLNHGTVTFTQFLRGLEQANISLLPAEIEYLERTYTQNGQISYPQLIRDLQKPIADANLAATQGSRAGVTAAFGEGFADQDDEETQKIMEYLRDGCRKRPVIGKSFFLDFDKLNDGIIVANQFARGLSLMYWAIFRRYPTESEIKKLIYKFWVDRLQHRELNDFEFDAKTNQARQVDYRAFVAAVGAAGPGEGVPELTVQQRKVADPAFKDYVTEIPDCEPERAFARISAQQQKFRFDFKAFLQARDKRQLGFLSLRDFVSGCVDAVPDFKRAGINISDFRQAASLFIDENAVKNANYTAQQLKQLQENPLNDDIQLINYRRFLTALTSIGDPMAAALKSGRVNQQETMLCIKDPLHCPALGTLRKYFQTHPVDLRQEFERFDVRHTGKVTGQQFKQVLAKAVQVHSKSVADEDTDMKHSARFIRNVVGINFDDLQSVCDFYAVDTISGIGDVQTCTASPDKLVGSGFLIDYGTFIQHLGTERDFVPSVSKPQPAAAQNFIVIPPISSVLWKIADSLGTRHLKFSDCLNQGEMQSTKWNRTIYGRISARKVHSSLSNMLDIQISDPELCSIAMACPADDGVRVQQFIADKCEKRGDEIVLPASIDAERLREYLDKSEVTVKALQEQLKQITDVWRPARATGISQKQQNEIIAPVVVAEPNAERSGMDVTLRSVKHLQDLTEGKEFDDLVLDQQLVIKNERVLVRDLYEFVQHPEKAVSLLEHAAAMVLAVYLELHIRAANMAPEFREFDKLKLGVVTSDQFARAFVLSNMGGLINKYPKSFRCFTELYTHTQAGKFAGMVDYALMLRDLGVPPPNSVFVSMADQEKAALEQKRPADYATEQQEIRQNLEESQYHASLQGLQADLARFCFQYKPKFREYFLDFDKARRGVCEQSKLGAALSQFKCEVNKDQEATLLEHYRSSRFGFQGCFEWRQFVEDLEKVVGFRL